MSDGTERRGLRGSIARRQAQLDKAMSAIRATRGQAAKKKAAAALKGKRKEP